MDRVEEFTALILRYLEERQAPARLARAIGVSRNTVASWKSRRSVPKGSLPDLLRWAKRTGRVPRDYVLHPEDRSASAGITRGAMLLSDASASPDELPWIPCPGHDKLIAEALKPLLRMYVDIHRSGDTVALASRLLDAVASQRR